MKLNRREGILLGFLLVVLTGALIYLYLWQPLLSEQAALRHQLETLTGTLDRLEPWEDKESELAARIENLRAQIRTVTEERELGIPLPEFLTMLENAAAATVVNLESTSIAVEDVGAVTNMQVAGTYHDLYRFLMLLEEQDEALVLEALQFTGTGQSLQGTLQVRLFSGAVIGEPKVGGFPGRSPFAARRQ
ncbi:MAG: type II secretion system protein M [Selenomonadales bacterium]|nr:type II secretion system protein M [Selenomonadales bacterium]